MSQFSFSLLGINYASNFLIHNSEKVVDILFSFLMKEKRGGVVKIRKGKKKERGGKVGRKQEGGKDHKTFSTLFNQLYICVLIQTYYFSDLFDVC